MKLLGFFEAGYRRKRFSKAHELYVRLMIPALPFYVELVCGYRKR